MLTTFPETTDLRVNDSPHISDLNGNGTIFTVLSDSLLSEAQKLSLQEHLGMWLTNTINNDLIHLSFENINVNTIFGLFDMQIIKDEGDVFVTDLHFKDIDGDQDDDLIGLIYSNTGPFDFTFFINQGFKQNLSVNGIP